MAIKFLEILAFTVLVLSCSAEKVSLSPVYSSLVQPSSMGKKIEDLQKKQKFYFHIAELTNTLNILPSLGNLPMDKEINILKSNLKEYAYAAEAQNTTEKKRRLKNIEKSYKKIQNLRSTLDQDYNEELNRYLVHIKSHIMKLEEIESPR